MDNQAVLFMGVAGIIALVWGFINRIRVYKILDDLIKGRRDDYKTLQAESLSLLIHNLGGLMAAILVYQMSTRSPIYMGLVALFIAYPIGLDLGDCILRNRRRWRFWPRHSADLIPRHKLGKR